MSRSTKRFVFFRIYLSNKRQIKINSKKNKSLRCPTPFKIFSFFLWTYKKK